MDGVQPAEAQAVVERHAGEGDPLGAAPGAHPLAGGAENQLRDVGRQDPEQRLALFQPLQGHVPIGQIAHGLEEAAAVGQRHQQARSPEARAVLAQMPALVLGPPLGNGGGPFPLGRARRAVFGAEYDVAVAAEDVLFGIAQQALGADVPGGDDAGAVHADDGQVGRALHQEPQERVAVRRSTSQIVVCLVGHKILVRAGS